MSNNKRQLVDRVSAHLYSLNNNSTDHTDDKLTDNLTTQIISERQRTKPCVALEVPNDKEGSHLFQALLDPASYKADEHPDIISYIAKPLANILKLKYPEKLITCNCKPATTCSAVGCFTTSKCIKIKYNLLDEHAKIENVEIAFRVVETLGSNDIIIGLSDVKRHDLTAVFRHLYTEEGHATNDLSAIGIASFQRFTFSL